MIGQFHACDPNSLPGNRGVATAFLPGICFIVLVTMPPQNLEAYRIGLVLGALALYGLTMPLRKALAIALNEFNSRP